MAEIAKIPRNRLPTPEQIGKILLAWAIIKTRQQMTSEISFPAEVVLESEHRQLRLDLDLQEHLDVRSLLQNIDSVYHQQHEDFLDSPEVASEWIRVKYRDDRWHVQADYSGSYACSFDQIFNSVYSQISESSLETKISQIETICPEDVQWLVQHAVHAIPPPNFTLGSKLIRESAQKWQNKVAVEAWDGTMTYSGLEEESNRLAKILIEIGISPRTVVPLAFEFSRWALVSLLAVWKAGAAFVFLDPNDPAARLRNLIKQVKASFILTQKRFHAQISELEITVLCVGEVPCTEKSLSLELPNLAETDDPAYIIFTSGSTGEPKAVVLTHLAFSSGAPHQAQLLGYTESTRTLQNAPLFFAAAISELLFTLLGGGCICIPKEKDRVQDLPGCVRQFQSNMLIISPSSAAIQDPSNFQPRQRLLMGSEPVPAHTAKRWTMLHDNCHAYGSSETNSVATCCPFSSAVVSQSVGPGASHQYWVVDALSYDRLVPPGWLGEIIVESHALAACYLGRDEATSKAFPETPRWHPGIDVQRSHRTRFFRSGDLGRIATDGTLEIHGRVDPLQVKLRGQRIELGEVEAITLLGLPQPCPVVAELILPKGQDRPFIAVFFLTSGLVDDVDAAFLAENVSFTPSQTNQLHHLCGTLQQKWTTLLPSFSRPSYLFPLLAFPRTATGKLNRKQLRSWCAAYPVSALKVFATSVPTDAGQNRGPLATKSELLLGGILSKILSVPQNSLSRSSAFTVLGGDSLVAIQLNRELRSHGLNVSISDVIQSDSLASLATLMDHGDAIDSTNSDDTLRYQDWDNSQILERFALDREQIEAVLPTTDSQSRAIELGTGPERCFVFHFILKFQAGLDVSKLAEALQGLVDRHDVLRTIFTRQEKRFMQVVLKHLLCPLEAIRLKDDQSVDEMVNRATVSDISIDQVPTKFWLFSVEDVPKTLVLRLSHAQFDGLSIPLLWDSLAAIYTGGSLRPAPSFSTYARKILLRDMSSSIAYFTQMLSDVPFTDLVQRRTTAHQPQNRHFERQLSIPLIPGFTAAHLFEAAWGYVLAKFTHERAVVFDQIVSGRQLSLPEDFDIQLLVGACLNDVPVVVRFPRGQTFRQLLTQIRTQHTETSGLHETLGFRRILEDCRPVHWPQNPRMKSSVQYRGFEDRSVFHIDGVECVASMVERSMDLEDLTVLVTPLRDQKPGTFDVKFLFSDEVVEERQALRWFEELMLVMTTFTHIDFLDKEIEETLGPVRD